MMNKLKFCLLLLPLLVLAGCRSANNSGNGSTPVPGRVVLYCSVDDVYARPIVRKLEQQTGLQIETIYDTEAAKTAGLAQRIRAEKARPQGDLFWSSALLQTLLLAEDGLLEPYQSPAARDIPDAFKSATGAWTGMGVRARVIVYHKSVINPPRSLEDLASPRFRDKVGISDPQFGTGGDWAAALATRRGQDKTLQFFRDLKKNGVRVLPGNSVVADRVARGELLAGVTDSDDFLAQRRKSKDILLVTSIKTADLPLDAVLVPGSVAMLKNAPHPEAARRLLDALVSRETEDALRREMPGIFPLRDNKKPDDWQSGGVDWSFLRGNAPGDTAQWPQAWRKLREPLAEILLLR